MKFKLTCESDETFENPSDDDAATEVIEDQEATEAVEETAGEVEEVVEMGFGIVEVLDNLDSLKKHVQKFGVTKQMLHLVNANNQLGDAIGMSLPYYESDDEVDEINEDEIPSTEVVMEGFADGLKKAKDAVVKFFKMIWEKLKNFFSAVFTKMGRLKKGLSDVEAITKKKPDESKFDDMKKDVNVSSFDDFKSKITSIPKGYDEVLGWKEGFDVNIDNLNASLGYCGKKIEEKDNSFTIKAVPVTGDASKATLKAHGWTLQAVSSILSQVKALVGFTDKTKKLEASLKNDEKAALKAIADDKDGSKDDKKDKKKAITAAAAVKLSATVAMTNEVLKAIGTYISIAKRLPVK